MKRLLILLPVFLLLVGCLSTPVKRNFPEVPPSLKTGCKTLKEVSPTDKLSEVLIIVTDNYSRFHECEIKVETWIEWYTKQKEIFDSVK